MAKYERVVIGIPTFRRPDLLLRLLGSLRAEVTGTGVAVLVADNDCDEKISQLLADTDLPVTYVPVAERGISQARNAILAAATQVRPDWTHVVMLDDDGYVLPGWLTPLMDTVNKLDAEITAGPVLGELPENASALARGSVYAGRTRQPTGFVDRLNGAQNIVVSRRAIDLLGESPFATELGRVGGEDADFFARLQERGGTFAWCDEAEVVEPAGPERLTASAIFGRAFLSNQIIGNRAARQHGKGVALRSVLTDARWLPVNTAAAAWRRDSVRASRAAIDAVGLAGRVYGTFRAPGRPRQHGMHSS
ncbi:glycosyltransferase [Dermatophilus congolensis]|uniref:glycosyltransferase n=1 Tax=Dermatophilus congolensis TaxID=1863 RepID=UPI001AB047DE|nr:glycosyltransferase [Dermatophilus congolensis]